MKIEEFAQIVPGLAGKSHVDKLQHFAWFLVTYDARDRFWAADMRRCYDQLHYAAPVNISAMLQKMAAKKRPDLLKDARGYRLEGRIRELLDGRFSGGTQNAAVEAMLQSLPGKISNEAERLFLSEALTCFRNKAFRATIVMTWNLAYDHLLNWVLAKHMAAFNGAIAKRYPKRAGVTVRNKDDFMDEFKESEVIELCGTAGILSDNMKKILHEELAKRNMAAHPSLVVITVYQAQDAISDLVNNVVLKLG
jgi:hypothetical protein